MAPNPLEKLSSLLKPASPETLILEIDLDRGVLQSIPENPLQAVRAINSPTMGVLVESLRKAAMDARVTGLVLHVGTCPITPTQVDELGRAVALFGKTKPTLAYTESFGELTTGMFAYRLASYAREIWLQPTGAVVLGGIQLDITLLRGGLAKLGVEPDFEKRYEYKTAADQFAATEVSDANREMMQRIADSLVDETVRVIADNRDLDSAAVRTMVDTGHLSASAAKSEGLVDQLGYRDEVYAAVRAAWGEKAGLQYVARYSGSLASRVTEQLTKRHQPTVAVVAVHGGIVTGRGAPASPLGGRQAGSETVTEHLRAAVADPDVVAIVLDVDSPGGSYIASDTIRRAVLRCREEGRPVVASMGAVAASGGYFVAMGADEVVALESTLTGSIGVFAGKMVTEGLFDKLGIVREPVTAGAYADLMSTHHRWTDEQRAMVDAWLDEVYDDFTAKVAVDRKLPIERVRELAKGRVWTGADAHERGLVDHLGGRETAIGRAVALAGSARDRVQVRPYPALGLLDRLRPAESSDAPGGMAAVSSPLTAEGLLRTAAVAAGLSYDGVLTMPYRITVG
jgi:protease-4